MQERKRIQFQLPDVVIDSHCHGRGGNESQKTSPEKVIREAGLAGISSTVFMPNTNPPLIDRGSLLWYLREIAEVKDNFGIPYPQYVYFGVTDTNLPECEDALGNKSVVGLKVYPKLKGGKTVTTGSIGVSDMEIIREAMILTAKSKKVIAVHCDDPLVIQVEGNTVEAEVSYVKKMIKIAETVPDARLVICHVSCRKSAELIIQAQKKGLQIAIEVTPHHLWFDDAGKNWDPDLPAVFYHCFNKLRPAEDVAFLLGLLKREDLIIFVGSDSACHTRKGKIEKGLGGIPSNQEMVPVILTLAHQNKISAQQVARLLSFNVADFFRLPKVSRKLKDVELCWQTRGVLPAYNNGKVVNPWVGSRLLMPV